MYICEKCGKEVAEKFGSGRFCSRKCSNSRVFSEESIQKKRIASTGMIAYSNGKEVKYFKQKDKIPTGYIKGNFLLTREGTSFEEFITKQELKNSKANDKFSKRQKSSIKIDDYLEEINRHNKEIIHQYENFLKNKAINKTFKIQKEFIFAKYYSVMDRSHLRSQQGHVFSHILLAEQLLDRPLNDKEIVHHKDENKLHNSFDNIYIFNNKGSHARFHYSKYYWLTIDKDVLICEKITEDLLKKYELIK